MNTSVKATPIVFTVSQITKAIKLHLESQFRYVMIKGEVTNAKLQSSGHIYFSLKDEAAQISCVMFAMDAKKLSLPLQMGNKITVRGELSLYEARGQYQIIVREVNFQGIGDQLLQLEELKQKLKALGYFDTARKRALPHLPRRIGVVTSETGAVIKDIIHVLTRRIQGFHLILNPVKVQGEGAAEEIALAIRQFNQYELADVLIVGRGGGSFEELSCFNDIRVATAIFESKIPVVSAVGHESDMTIADFVADVRAPTPSAAAEIISLEKQKLLDSLAKMDQALVHTLSKQLAHKKELLRRSLRHPLFQSRDYLLTSCSQQLDDIKERLHFAISNSLREKAALLAQTKRACELARPTAKLTHNRQRIDEIERAIQGAMHTRLSTLQASVAANRALLDNVISRSIQSAKKLLSTTNYSQAISKQIIHSISSKKESLRKLHDHLSSVNPKNLLQRGYSILFHEKDGSVITSVTALETNDMIQIQMQDGKIASQVVAIQQQG